MIQIIEKKFNKSISIPHNNLILYHGISSFSIADSLITQIKENYLKPQKINKRVYATIVELLNNAVRYTSSKIPLFFLFMKENENCLIICGNYIDEKSYEKLLSVLEKIHSLSDEDLKKEYFDKLENDFSESGGAGIGLLEVNLKSNFSYKIEKITENSYFYLVYSFFK